MMWYLTLPLLLLCVNLFAGCKQLQEIYEMSLPRAEYTTSPSFDPIKFNKVAILVEDNTRRFRRSGYLRQVEDEFVQAVIRKGYTVATRSDIEQIKKELKFQDSGWTDEDIMEVGRMLNVPAILIVSINDSSDDSRRNSQGTRIYYASASIGSRLLNVEKAEILWLASYTGTVRISKSNQRGMALAPVARVVAEAFPNRIETN